MTKSCFTSAASTDYKPAAAGASPTAAIEASGSLKLSQLIRSPSTSKVAQPDSKISIQRPLPPSAGRNEHTIKKTQQQLFQQLWDQRTARCLLELSLTALSWSDIFFLQISHFFSTFDHFLNQPLLSTTNRWPCSWILHTNRWQLPWQCHRITRHSSSEVRCPMSPHYRMPWFRIRPSNLPFKWTINLIFKCFFLNLRLRPDATSNRLNAIDQRPALL